MSKFKLLPSFYIVSEVIHKLCCRIGLLEDQVSSIPTETITTLTNNNNGTATYINEAGISVTIPIGGITVVDNLDGTYLITLPNGSTVIISDTSVSTLVNNGNGTYTYTDETGLVTVISDVLTTITNTLAGHKIADYTNENGAIVAVNETVTSFVNLVSGHKIADYVDENGTFNPISESVTPLVDNLDGTYTYADEQGVQTTFDTKSLTTCELEGDGLLGTEIKIKDSFYDSVDINDVTGNITQTDETLDVEEAFVVKDGCKLKVFVNKPMGLLEFTGGDLTLTDLQNKAFVEISIDDTLTANIDMNTWFASCTNKFEGQQITIHCNDDLTTFDISYTRTTLAHTDTIIIDQQAMFFSFTVVNKAGVLELKLN